MTRKEANKEARNYAKQYVRNYFKSEGNFNFDKFGSTIIKKELYHAFKMFWVHFDAYSQTYHIMTLGNKIIA
jgi:hypothetical protein